MNIRTPTDIDRIVDEAVALADLTGPQTGTAPTPRVPRYEAPVDQPPVEFAGEEGDRARRPSTPIQRLAALGATTQAAVDIVNADDECRLDEDEIELGALIDALAGINDALLRLPASNWADVQAKLIVWQELIADSACIHEEDHVPLFEALQADVARLAGRAA